VNNDSKSEDKHDDAKEQGTNRGIKTIS